MHKIITHFIAFTLFFTFSTFSVYSQTPTISVMQGMPTGNFAGRGIAYGNGAYVAIFQDGNMYRSTDADSWTKVTDPSLPAGDFRGISFGAGVFVLVGYDGLIASSTDGISWTQRTSSTTNHLNTVEFLNGSFYAVGYNRTIRQSADGITWNSITVNAGIGASTDYFNSISYGNGVYVFGARTSGHSGVLIYRSTTATSNSWSFQNVVFGSLNRVQYLGNRFYIFMSNTHVYTSTDGSSWTNSTASMPVTLPNLNVQTVGSPNQTFHGIYDGTKWYLFGSSQYHGGYGSIYSSNDGINFTLEPRTIYIVAQGAAYINGKYFMYGNEGLVGSDDGVNYRYYGGSFYGLATNGSGTWAAASPLGTMGVIFSSPDFETWTSQTTSYFNELYAITWDGSRFVAGGRNIVAESADGSSWSSLSTPPFGVGSIIHDGTRYVAAAYDPTTWEGTIQYSADGINWTAANTVDNYYFKIRRVNGQYFAIGYDNASWLGVIMHSTDGLTWNDVTPSIGFDVAYYSDVTYDGTRYHFSGSDYDNYEFFTVSTTTPANSASYGNVGRITSAPGATTLGSDFGETVIAYSNGRFAGAAFDLNTYEAFMLYSTDGVNWTGAGTGIESRVNDIVASGDQFRMVGTNDAKFLVNFGSTLPVSFRSFDAKLIQGDARLAWTTASEQNSLEFRVQHSLDGSNWEELGRVAAAGNSDRDRNYSFTHPAPAAGAHYYRLLQVDIDGRQHYSDVRLLQVIGNNALRLYPNPAAGNVQIQRTNTNRVYISVVNSQGQRMYQSWHSENQVTLPSQSWPAGIYKIQVEDNGVREVLTLMKR